jgi:hypothetical protein
MVAADVNRTEPMKNVQPATAGLSEVFRLIGTPIAKQNDPSAKPIAVGVSSREMAGAGRLTTPR